MQQQILELDSSDLALRKSLVISGKREERTLKSPDWSSELKAFSDIDLNTSAWKNSYRVDSTLHDDIIIISYKSIETKAPLQSVYLQIKNKDILSLDIKHLRSTYWYSIEQELSYTKGKGYSISVEQNSWIGPEENYQIRGHFIRVTH